MKKSYFDLHLFTKYMISYAVIIVVFGCLLSYIYYQFYGMLCDNALKERYNRLYRGVEELNNQMDDMHTIAALVGEQQVFSELGKLKDPVTLPDYYKLWEARNVLSNLYNSYEIGCNVLFRNNSLFVSNRAAVSDSKSKYSAYTIYEELSVEELSEQIFADPRSMIYLGEQTVGDPEGAKEVFSLAVKMPVNVNASYDSAILFLFDKEKLIGELIGKETDEGIFLYVTDGEDHMLLRHHFEREPLDLTEGVKGEYLKIGEENYYILSEKAAYGNMRVVVGISERIFEKQVAPITKVILVFITASVLLAVILAVAFATRRVTYVKKIMGMFSREKHPGQDEKNEYLYIESSVNALFQENRQFRDDVERMEVSMRTSLIEKALLYGVYDPAENRKMEDIVGKAMEFYCVVCMRFDCESRQEALRLSVLMKELVEAEFSALSVSGGLDEMVFLLPLSADSPTDMRSVLDFLEIQVNSFHSILVSVSGIGTGVDNIHICYEQAKNRMRQIFAPTERFIYSDEGRETVMNRLANANLDVKLQGLVFSGQKSETETIFEKLKKDIPRQMFEDEQEIMQFFFDLRSPLKNVYDYILKEENERKLPEYKTSDSVNEILESLEEFALYLCDRIQEQKQSKLNAMKDNIVEYLKVSYEDPDLCAASVAERFGISKRYVFSIIKDCTGKTFNEYLEKIRMEKTEQYLANTDIPINKIGFMVGFNTTDAFYKVFKRVNGIAPGKWRENFKDLGKGEDDG